MQSFKTFKTSLSNSAYSNYCSYRTKQIHFLVQIVQKRYFGSIREKVNITVKVNIFGLFQVSNFVLNRQFRFFLLNFPKNVHPVQDRKSYHHRLQYIRIIEGIKFLNYKILGSKFHLKEKILIFCTKFAPNDQKKTRFIVNNFIPIFLLLMKATTKK